MLHEYISLNFLSSTDKKKGKSGHKPASRKRGEVGPHLDLLSPHGRMTKMHLLKLCPFFFVDFD